MWYNVVECAFDVSMTVLALQVLDGKFTDLKAMSPYCSQQYCEIVESKIAMKKGVVPMVR
jgi:hypothetical protein